VTLVITALVAEAAGGGFAPQAGLSGQTIVAIEFECAAPIDRQGLRRLVPKGVGEQIDAQDVERLRQRLEQTNIFTEIAVQLEPRDGGVALLVRLVRKPVVNAVRFRGNHEIGDAVLLRVARVQEGSAFTDELRDYALTRIRERYVAEGFVAARVEAVVRQRGAGDVDVAFQISEGTPLRLGSVDIEGELPVPVDEVRAAAGIEAGDRYARARQQIAEAAIARLLRSKRYYETRVHGDWLPGEDRTGVLRFTIDSGPLFLILFSGNRQFSDADLRGLVDLAGRAIVTDGTWREFARRVQRAYQEAGYYSARVDLRLEPGPPKVVRFEIEEGRRFHVTAVRFEGNQGVSAAVLRAQMATRPASWIPWRSGVFLDDVFDEDLKRLWYLYRHHGYQAAEIVDARTDFDENRGTIAVTVVVEEGALTIVRRVERVGVEPLAGSIPRLEVAEGEPLDPGKVEADRQALLGAFARIGYTGAQVTAEVQTAASGATQAATVRFIAVAGEQQHVGVVVVQNDFDTRWRVIERELHLEEGAALNPDALLRGQTNIYQLGLFRSVTVRPLEGGARSGSRDVAVSVSEKPAGTLSWGAGYNTRDGFRGFGEIGYANLQGLARRLSLRGEISLDPVEFNANDYSGNLGFREPHLGDTQWTLRANVIAQRSTTLVDPFSLERVAFVPALERLWLPGLQGGIEAQADESRVFDVEPDVLAFNPRDEGRLRTVSLGPFLVYDGRDDAFVPRRGVFDSLRLRYAPDEFGSEIPFVKLVGQHIHYVPLNGDLTLVYVLRGGWARALEQGDIVPIQDRFFLGGRTTVRGFAENSIGPTGSVVVDTLGRVLASGHPVGGDLVLNLNTELRFPLLYGFGGVVFADGGGVYFQDRAISLNDFRRSSGLGLRYVTPVGALSLEYGFKLDRRSGESLGQVHFSIGNIF
jgi:outer membrane protein assembly complex protein YaeT